MKRFFLPILICLLLCVIFVACDNSVNTEVEQSAVSDVSVKEAKSNVVGLGMTAICEPKEKSNVTIDDNFADDCVNVLIDKYHSAVNKDQSYLFIGIDNIKRIDDVTHMDRDLSEIDYDWGVFRQIIRIELEISSKENVLRMISQIESIEGVLWVGVNSYIELDATPTSGIGWFNDGFADDPESPSADKEYDLNIGNVFLLVSLDKEHSGINKDQTLMFVGIDNIAHIEDITHIDGDIDQKKYLNKDEFMQIIKVFLIDISEDKIAETARQISQLDGVVAVERNSNDFKLFTDPPAMSGTRYPSQWGLHGENGINAPSAWNYSVGS